MNPPAGLLTTREALRMVGLDPDVRDHRWDLRAWGKSNGVARSGTHARARHWYTPEQARAFAEHYRAGCA